MSRLSTATARVRAVPGFGRDVVTILVMVVVGLLVGGVVLANQRVIWPWEDRYVFSAAFNEVPGISPGNGQEVRMFGVPVGVITEAKASDDGTTGILTMNMDGRYGPVYRDASLVLRPKSPLNEMYVELDPGSPEAGELAEDEVVPVAQTKRPVQIDEILTDLGPRAREGLRVLLAESDIALANASDSVPAAVAAANATFAGLQPVAERLAARDQLIRRLIASLSDIGRAIGEDDVRLAALVDDARRTLTVVADSDSQLEATIDELPATLGALHDGITEVKGLTGRLDPALDNLRAASEELPEALNGLGQTVVDLDAVVDSGQPFLDQATPVLNDLRPFLGHARPAAADAAGLSPGLDPLTAVAVEYLPDLQAFVYNSNSVFSTEDANGPIFRGMIVPGMALLTPESVPLANPSFPTQDVGGQ